MGFRTITVTSSDLRWHQVEVHHDRTTFAMNTPAGCVLRHHDAHNDWVGSSGNEHAVASSSSSMILLPGVRLDQRWEVHWSDPREDEVIAGEIEVDDGLVEVTVAARASDDFDPEFDPHIVLRRVYALRSSKKPPTARPFEWYDADADMPRPPAKVIGELATRQRRGEVEDPKPTIRWVSPQESWRDGYGEGAYEICAQLERMSSDTTPQEAARQLRAMLAGELVESGVGPGDPGPECIECGALHSGVGPCQGCGNFTKAER